MADELLSQTEIDVLLGRGATASAGELPAAQRAALRPVMETAARLCAGELSGLLRRTVRMRVDRLSTSTHSGLLAAAELPSYQTQLSAQLSGQTAPAVWPVEIRSSILFPLIDCLLGGGHEPTAIAPRPLTEIERRLAGRVVRLLAAALEQAWAPLAAIAISDSDGSQRLAGCESSADKFILVRFVLELAGEQGSLLLAIPRSSLTLLLDPESSEPTESAGVEIVAVLAESPFAADQSPELAVGDILATDERASEPIRVLQNGELRYHARLGAQDDRKAIEIVSAVVEVVAEAAIEPAAESPATASEAAS